ncbi:MAG: hypothetical protein O2955_20460, partial [Planctomycetota bacterium]|nr:hypothetical protein [Planctomycetota bacterium]
GTAGTTFDPFRDAVRNMLTIEMGDSNIYNSIRKVQRKLSLNGLAEIYPPFPAPDPKIRIRPLTPHPLVNPGADGRFGVAGVDDDGNGIIDDMGEILWPGSDDSPIANSVISTIPSPPSYPEDITGAGYSLVRQEYLARYDRQRMARDIYVLLYAFCGGRDDVDYRASNALLPSGGRPIYSDTHLQEMAQFAVNIVDALDPDDIITVFEYDRDLGINTTAGTGGWDLGDNAFLDDETSREIAANASGVEERAVVYGVEAQQLTFGEAMAVLCKRVADSTGTSYVNHGSTEIDDQEHRDFTFIELINVSPRVVDFATENDGWQIAVKPEDTGSGVATGSERRLTLTTAAGSVSTGTSPGFTIGTAGDGQNKDMSGNYLPSYLNVDYNWTMATINPMYTRIAPDASGSGLSLDLITTPTSTYRINQAPGSSTAQGDGTQVFNDPKYGADPAGGDLLHLVPTPSSTLDATLDAVIDDTQTIVMELRRRVNTHRTSPVLVGSVTGTHEAESQDNPWVVVDRIRVPLQVFNLAHNTDAASSPNIGTKLDQVKSKERFQPLYGGIRSDDTEAYTDDTGTQTPVGGAHIYNSLGGDNRSSPPTYSLWQPYLDREFSTSYELFTVPVHSPRDTTLNLGSRQSEDFTTASSPLLVGWYAGINRFLQPGKIIGWNATTVYQYGEEIVPSLYSGEIYRCTTAGTSGAAPPTWGGATVGDGSVTWHKIPGARANRWARLLEFFEVPAREGRHDEVSPNILDLGNLGNNDTDWPAGGIRQPGRINLNTLRHPANLAGLFDDPDVMSINPTATGLQTLASGTGYLPAWDPADTLSPTLDPFYDPLYPGRTRDWWAEFIRARDGLDPISLTYIPGIPGARPYRGLNFTAEGGSSIDHTIFRDISTADGRKLFELGSINDHYNSSLDFVSRQRLLTKLGQTTTTRSNVFIVHMQVDFFEAKEIVIATPPSPAPPITVVRIGAKLPDSPGHRGFFVVDRSRALEMLTAADLPGSRYVTGMTPPYPYTYSFNRREDDNGNGVIDAGEDVNGNGILDRFPFRSLIIHRQSIK